MEYRVEQEKWDRKFGFLLVVYNTAFTTKISK